MDKLSYSLGISVGQNLQKSGVDSLNVKDFTLGVVDTLDGKEPQISLQEAGQILQEFTKKVQEEAQKKSVEEKKKNQELGKRFLEINAKRKEIVTTKSGLQYLVLNEGTGKQPGPHSRVQCHYTGSFISGEKFDSSYDRGTPAVFGLDQVISGWTEGLQLMKEGSVYQFFIPYQLGYGENGMPGAIPPCSTLIFKVELIKVL